VFGATRRYLPAVSSLHHPKHTHTINPTQKSPTLTERHTLKLTPITHKHQRHGRINTHLITHTNTHTLKHLHIHTHILPQHKTNVNLIHK
jgi:hypothetical protein